MSDTEESNSRKRPADFDELFEEGDDTKATYESEDDLVDEDGNVVGDMDLTKAGTQAWLVKVTAQAHLVRWTIGSARWKEVSLSRMRSNN